MKVPSTPLPAAHSVAQKISVSLFEADMARIDAIADFVKAKAGVRLNTSQAIKLALRAAELDSRLLEAWKAVQADDGRRRPAQAAGPRPKRQRKTFEVTPATKELCRGILDRLPKTAVSK